jgi:hypothetical protein
VVRVPDPASAAAAAPARFVDLAKYPEGDRLLVRVGWTPDSLKIVYQVQNREQTWLDLNGADPDTGNSRTLLRENEPRMGRGLWMAPYWLRDGTFLWQSERTGWRHLYHYRAGRLADPAGDDRPLGGAGVSWGGRGKGPGLLQRDRAQPHRRGTPTGSGWTGAR